MKKSAITMNINTNTKNNRLEIVFSEKPNKEVIEAIKGIKFVYRNIDGQLMWLCTAKYLVKEDYNAFIKEYCKDFKKNILTDGKPNKTEKKAEKKAPKKTTAKKTEVKAKTDTASDEIAELRKELAELKKELKAIKNEPKTPKMTAKRIATDNSDSNAPKSKYQLIVNGKVIR